MIHTCQKGHRSVFRSCPQCSAQARPLKSVATRAQEVLDSAKQARQARRYKKALAGIALAQKQRQAMDAWEVGKFPVGLA